MKNILKSMLLLIGVATIFTACKDDRDSNPTLQQPTTFVLNTPSYAAAGIDLATSSTLNFTWSQPDYGFPVAATYQFIVSRDGSHTYSVAEAQADEKELTTADYALLDASFTSCTGSIDASLVATALQQLYGYEEDAVPDTQSFVMIATATTAGAQTIYSNPITLTVHPTYVELRDAEIVMWYLVGNCVADNDWDNGTGSVGAGLVPLFLDPDLEYDKAKGTGLISTTLKLPAGGAFKFVQVPGNWDIQLNAENNVESWPEGKFHCDGDGNFAVDTEGYYTLSVNTATNKVTIEEYEGTPKTYDQIGTPGSHNEWNVNEGLMTACGGNAREAHVWRLMNVELPGGKLKFAANGSWDVNWGGTTFYYGVGTQGGADIEVPAGTYDVYLNDITGQYMFIAK